MAYCESSEALFRAMQTLIRGLKVAEANGAGLAGERLCHSDLQALMLVGERERCIVSDVAHGLNISPTTASSLVDRLVRNNYVARHRTEHDRRIVRLKLTPEGAKIREEAVALQLLHCRQMLDELTPGEAEAFVGLITKIGEGLTKTEAQKVPA